MDEEPLIPPADSHLLNALAKSSRSFRERERLRALYAVSIGHGVLTVAGIFSVDPQTIRTWARKWNEDRNLADGGRSGRPPALEEEDKKEIKDLVKEGDPQKHGTNASLWDCKELARHFAGNRGKSFSQETVRRFLKASGARYVKAVAEYAEADRKKQEAFATRFFDELPLDLAEYSLVLFEDECSVSSQPRKGYGWTFKKRLVIKPSQKDRERSNCFGAVSPFEGKLIQMTTKEAKAPAFVRFLRKVEREHPGRRIVLYADNLNVHKSRKVRAFLGSRKGRIELRFLPPYSPKMNPQEQWWNYQRRKFLNNRGFSGSRSLAASLAGFVRRTPPEQVMRTCSIEPIGRFFR